MVNMTVHHISKQLDIEEHWTEEPTPQLRHVKIIDIKGILLRYIRYIEMCPNDLEKTIETLQKIHSDMLSQKRLKARSKHAKGWEKTDSSKGVFPNFDSM